MSLKAALGGARQLEHRRQQALFQAFNEGYRRHRVAHWMIQ